MRTRQEKAETWAALARLGTSLTDIAKNEGITRERVRQVLRSEGHEERMRMRGRSAVDPLQVMLALRDSRAVSASDTGSLLGVKADTVRRALDRIGRRPAAERLWKARAGRAARVRVLQAVAAFVAEHGRTPGVNDAIRGAFPIAHTSVIRLFGSWNAAILAAGFTPRRLGGANHIREN